MDKETILGNYLKELGIFLDKKTSEKIMLFLDMLYDANKCFNITGTKEKNEILFRHFFDSFSLLQYEHCLFHKENLKIIDVGTGGGLPGLLLAIVLNKHHFVLLDKNKKKTSFIRNALNILEIKNAKSVRADASVLAHDLLYRESYDLVIARAVTKIHILSELIIPFCKINGKIILYKSRLLFDEISSVREWMYELGVGSVEILEAKIPYLNAFRAFVVLSKRKKTDLRYPRPMSKIKKDKRF